MVIFQVSGGAADNTLVTAAFGSSNSVNDKLTAQTTLVETIRAALVQESDKEKIATLFNRGQGKTIHEKFNALFDAIIATGTAATINAANTNNLNALTGAFPTSNSIDQRLDAILNALVTGAASTDTSAVSTINTQFNGAGKDINAKLSAILNALVRNAATNSNPAGQITAQFANGEGQDLDSKMDAVLNALVQNAATSSSPNPAGAITAKFDNMADNTLAVAVDIENTRRVDLRLDSTRYAVNCLQTVVSNNGILDNCTCTFQIVFTLFFQVDQLAAATPSVSPTGTTCTAPAQIITLDNIGALP